MAKREFLQLAHVINFDKHIINSAYMSEKYDGMRAFWDGGVSRGVPADQVPWANTAKDHIRVSQPIATGLWSRYGKVIHAPASFLDNLPPLMLDGELYLGRQRFEETMSICRSLDAGDRWDDISYMVLDAPAPRIVFADGKINNKPNFVKEFVGCVDWIQHRGYIDPIPSASRYTFKSTYHWLCHNLGQNEVLKLVPQEVLPAGTQQARDRIEERLTEILAVGGEGLILRRPAAGWIPQRTHDCMKYKPEKDDEGTVTGYVWGRETDRGSKLLGLMGAMILDYKGKRLELSGFTDTERVMCYTGRKDGLEHARKSGEEHAGEEVDAAFENATFPRGSTVTFKYRELTRDGIPKEARYYRKRVAE